MAEPLEEIVVNAALYRIGDELPVAQSNGYPDDEKAIAEIQKAKERLAEIGELHAKGKVSATAWLAAVAPLERQIEQAEKGLARTQGQTTLVTFPLSIAGRTCRSISRGQC
jgi:hypothetical protein